MRDPRMLMLALCLAWVACGNDPVADTPLPDRPDGDVGTGRVVFPSGGLDSAAQWGADDYELHAAGVTGGTLAVTLSYSGGCRTHRFTLVAAEGFMESDPVQLALTIAHDADGDACEAWITEEYRFLLDPIKARYRAAYRTESGTVVLGLDRAPAGSLDYTFD